MTRPSASRTVEVSVPAEAVYAMITDKPTMARRAEETGVMRWTRGASTAPGSVSKGTNRNGWRRWTTPCTVTDAEPGRRFAFDVTHTVVPISRWQYEIEPMVDGCT